MVDYKGISIDILSKIPCIITATIIAHDNYYGDDVILQSWFIAKKLW